MGNEPQPRDPFSLGDDDGVDAPVGERWGIQTPPEGHCWIPPYTTSLGDQAMWFLNQIGFVLDQWQEFVLRSMLNLDETGDHWAAEEVLLLVPRQNGKTAIIEARELVGLYVLGEKLCLHTAVLFASARESYYRNKTRIQRSKLLDPITHFRSGNDNMSIEINDRRHKNFGGRVVYMARGTANARGWSADVIVLDEAFSLDEEVIAGIDYATSARRNPCVIYSSSTGKEDSLELEKIRERGLQHDPDMLFLEWCADGDCDLDDEEQYYQSNPALGIRISIKRVRKERNRHSDRIFGRERLGLWADKRFRSVIPPDVWKALCGCNGLIHKDHRVDDVEPVFNSIISSPVVAVDSDPDGIWTTVSLAGWDENDNVQVEIWREKRGVTWAVDCIAELYNASKNPPPVAIILEAGATAGRLLPEMEALGARVIPLGRRDVCYACKFLYDRSMDGTLRHLGDISLASALDGATKVHVGKMAGDVEDPDYRAWYWGRRDGTVDITGLCASTYAAWGLNVIRAEELRDREDWEDKPMGGWAW